MDIITFIKNFAEQFEDTDTSVFTSDTVFKELDEWSSLLALEQIAMIDEEYGVVVKGEDIRNSRTIGDLFALVDNRKQKGNVL